MHPVSIRGRSMPRDRRTIRAILVVMGSLCCSLSTGCLRSTMLRPADGPVAQPAPANGPVAPVLAPPSAPKANTPPAGPAAMPPPELQAAPAPVQNQAALAPLTSQPPPAIPPVTAPTGNAPAAKPTPLMDAAIERVATVTRQQLESLDPATAPAESDDHAATAVAPGSPPVLPTAPVQRTPAPILVLDTTESTPLVTATVIEPIDSPTQPPVPAVPKGEVERIGAEIQPKTGVVAGVESADPTRETPGALLDDTQPASVVPAMADPADPLAVGKLCLCRKIVGFGSYEPLTESWVKAGQQVLLYCEMTGMRYEANDASFVSRLSSKIEIGSVGSGIFQWALELGPEEDVCASRRHDFFVNYKFSVPPGLPPGSYRLRLTQTDLIANRSTAAEIPLIIVPGKRQRTGLPALSHEHKH
jgi:hypothetical protein